MTQEQYQWLKDNGYDPAVYDVDDQGNIFENPVGAEPKREVMSKPRAFGTSFAGSVLPTAGGLAASAPFIGLSIANPLIGIPALIASGMAGGYGTGKLQEAALERFAPEAIAEMQRAQTDQPVMSYLGGFAPSALAFRPSLGGVKGLTAPLMSGSQAAKRAAFIPAAVNVGANVGSAGAGQLLNISEGGEFSAPRFAADVALGSLLSKPTFIGRKMGFPDLAPEVQPIERLDLAGERGAIAGREAEAARAAAFAEDEAASARATELLGANAPRQAEMFGPDARRFELAENQRVVSEAFDKLGLEKNPEVIQDYVNDPMLSNFRDDPAAVLDYVSEKSGLKAQKESATFEAEYAGKPTEFENVPLKQQIVTDGRRTEIAENRQAIDNALKRLKTSVPEEVVQDLANDPMLGNVRDNPEELTRFIAEKADKYLENSWRQSLEKIKQLDKNLENLEKDLAREEVALIDREQERAWAAKEQGITDIASELQARFQREGGEGRITQADIDAAAEIAAKRGLKMQFTTPEQQAQGIRGAYMINEAGERVIYIDANAATRDTAIHEIGHDVFVRSANERMKRSLMQTAEDSAAFKAEYEARLAEVDKNGQRVNTDEQARNLALEEGVIQAFGEAYPNVPRGEIRAWFNALKASLKSMVGMKISPEDAARWLHYATTELVPWKGVAVGKGGEERMQRAVDEQAVNQMIGESVSDNIKPLVEAINLKYEDIINSTGMMPEMRSTLGNYIQQVVQENPSAFDYFRYKVGNKTFADKEIGQLRGVNEAVKESLLTGKPIELSESAANNYKAMAQDVVSTMRELRVDNSKVANIEQLLSVLVNRKIQNDSNIIQQNENVKRWSDPAFRQQQSADYKRYNYQRAAQELTQLEGQLSSTSDANTDIRYQRAQQETPEFKNWFGESKVVDADGKPLTVYHGTYAPDFTSFRTKTGYNYGPGAYFTPEPVRAAEYAETRGGSRVYPAYVSLKNPYRVTSDASVQDIGYKIRKDPANVQLLNKLMDKYDARNSDILGNGEIGNAWLREQGYDGIIKERNRYTEDGFVPEIVEVVAFKPEQVKSATGNKGTFDPSNPDIRYQRGPVGKAADAVKAGVDKTLGEIDQITRRGGIYETVGRSLTRMYNTAQSMFGRSQAIAPEIYKLGDADAIKLTKHLLQEHRTRTRITPAPEITAAYNEWRNIVKRFWVDENNAVGNTIRQGTGMRERIIDEFWLPFHKESDNVRKILSERVGTPEYQKLKDDYVREATDSYLQQGMNQQAARNKAIADFETERSVILAPFDPSAPATFAGARKSQGRPLPESWGELNFRDLLESYNRRSAKDYAAQMALERSPEVMTALGSKKMHNDQPIPATILQNTPIISTDPSVQSVLREFSGRPLQTPGKFVRGIGSIASALALQTVSRIGDIGGTVTKPLAYVGLGDYATYMSGMADKLSNWSQLQLRSIESGLNNPNAHQNFRQAISVGDDAGKYMKRFVNSIGSLTLSNKLESIARTLAQAQGEMIVSINKRKAMTGDKDAVRFLDTLNADWRTTNDTDLAGQFGLLMQGSYDMRQLPAWFLESGAAPYLTWSKWSMSQMNNFRKFAVEPAMQGDFKPLIAQLLVGMAGGGAIEEIQEWLNNKESKAINWSELQSWAEQNEGEIGSDGGQLLTQKLLMMAQKTGTFGFAGDLMLLPVNALVGDTQGVIGAYPALELTTDLAKNIGGALGAIDKGEDVGLVLKRFGKNMIVGKTQVLRVISNWADELENEGAENLRSADRRKQRLFDELNGMSRAGMFPVSYDNLAEQEFERGVIDEDTGEEAFELVSKAREEATSREDYASRIRKYKTSQNQIMPSLERQPMKAARYLSFVEGAEEGAGAETVRRYMTREYENKYRKSLIEGMSGLR